MFNALGGVREKLDLAAKAAATMCSETQLALSLGSCAATLQNY